MNSPKALKSKHVYLVASGDLRLTANQECWPAQAKMEEALTTALEGRRLDVVRAHPYDPPRSTASSTPRRWAWRCSANSIRRRR